MTLRSFLSETKMVNLCGLQKTLKFVIGNEACDLDSCVSSMIYAHALQQLRDENVFCIPILNILRKNYQLKTEVNHWFKHFGISPALLTFKDDINYIKYCKEENAEIVLVDHNVPAPSDKEMEPFVSSVIDHHALERSSTPVHGMIVEPVGSCCTLITEQVKEKAPNLITEDVAKLLYGTIIFDTINMDPKAKRTTKKDEDIVQYLENILNTNVSHRDAIYKELSTAWCDITSLSLEQILCKDQKKIAEGNFAISVSAVPMLIQELESIRNLPEVLPSFATQNEYDLVILMGMHFSEELRRDLLIYATKKSVLLEISKFLETAEESCLQLEQREIAMTNGRAYTQRNIAASRKKVIPLIKEWLQTL